MDSSGLPFRQLVASVLALLTVLACAGCVRVPTSTTVEWDKENELIESLTGARVTDVRSQLGEPTDTFKLRDVTYLFYKRFGDQKNFMYVLVPGWSEDQKTDIIIQCLLVESRNDTVVHAEIKSYSAMLAWHNKYSNTKHATFRGCPSLFWKNEELERIEAAAKDYRRVTLTAEAEKGDLGAAKILAFEFKELRYLRELAAAGNPEAAATLNRDSCQRIYYRADESRKPQADDKFVHVCGGDDLSVEETVLISADWDKTYSTPPRRYFKTIPKGLR